jgi:hypothetical protein
MKLKPQISKQELQSSNQIMPGEFNSIINIIKVKMRWEICFTQFNIEYNINCQFYSTQPQNKKW